MLGRARHIALRHQRVEREHQVDASNIPFGHPRHILFSFPQVGSNCHDPLQRSIYGRAAEPMAMLQAKNLQAKFVLGGRH